MQNANIRYVIRIEGGEHKGREVEINLSLSEYENEWDISDELDSVYGIKVDTWGSEYYTVMERNIEVFND